MEHKKDMINISNTRLLFKNALLEDGDIHMDYYLDAYKELVKFCQMLGSVFSFVKDEIESKSSILIRLKTDKATEFKSVKSMIQFESESGLLKKPGYESGCRTLLRLHWGLNFIRTFFRKVHELELDQHTSTVGRDVYQQTLGCHHVWYVRMGASLAMCSLPVKKSLLEKLCGGDIDYSILDEVPDMLDRMDAVYQLTETIYKNNKLLDLP